MVALGSSQVAVGGLRQPRLAGLKVLVVEDEQDSRELLAEFLEFEGAEVRTAEDAARGMEALSSFKPAVLVSDIGMPGEDGHSFVRRLRSLPRDAGSATPAIALTAYVQPEDRAKSLAAGFDEHMGKPVDFDKLVKRIAQLCDANR